MNEDLTQLWMVPYADLMSTLVLLFMSLFAYSYANKTPEYDRALAKVEQEISNGKHEQAAARKVAETEIAVQMKKELEGLRLKDFGVQVDQRYVRLTLPAPVLFGEGSVRVGPEGAAVLAPLAKLLARSPDPVLVEGHTDDLPISGARFRSNWELAAGRSFAVIDFFIAQGLPAERFQARGYGEHRPVASNATPEGRARNRRIEISLVRSSRTAGDAR